MEQCKSCMRNRDNAISFPPSQGACDEYDKKQMEQSWGKECCGNYIDMDRERVRIEVRSW